MYQPGYRILLFLPLLLITIAAAGQSKTCGEEMKGFVLDSQEYLIDAKETSTFVVVFYPGFTYRVELCSENPDIGLNFQLTDEKGNIHFGQSIQQGFFREFRFDTVFHGKILIKPVKMNSKPAQLVIGYKKNKN